MRRAVIYLACPMTIGGFDFNTRKCLEIADRLMVKGYCPIPPVLSFLWGVYSPKSHEDWLQHDFSLIRVSDGVLRIKGDSEGADREMDFAVRHDVPVFLSEYELYSEMSPNIEENE